MEYTKKEIKNGITVHNIDTEKFKTNLTAIFLTTPLTRKYVTFDSVLTSVLRSGSKNMPTQEEISKTMEEMYGASFDCGIDKTGDNHILKFYIESVNDEFLPQNSINMLEASLEKIIEIVFNPYLENGIFKQEYVDQEKENMRQRIDGKIDNKAAYAKARCVEEMYRGEPASFYRYGYTEDLPNISAENLYKYYAQLIQECKIDIFISGNINKQECINFIEQNENIQKLQPRDANYIINNITAKPVVDERLIEEKNDVTQGKLVIGCDIIFNKNDLKDQTLKYQCLLYNSMLGRKCKFKIISKCKREGKFSIYSKF